MLTFMTPCSTSVTTEQWKGALTRIIPSLLGHLKNKAPEKRHHHTIYIKTNHVFCFQILQNLANHVLFSKEKHMEAFNGFLQANFEKARE